jgi:hypothetical protein
VNLKLRLTSGRRRALIGATVLVLAGVGIAIVAAGSGGGDDTGSTGSTVARGTRSTSTHSTPKTTAAIVVERKTITISATSKDHTKPVALSGSYAVHFTKTGDCSYVASIVSRDDPSQTREVARTDKVAAVDASAEGLAAGYYFVQVITGPVASCGWSLTLTPI